MLLLAAILCAPFTASAQVTIGSGVAPRDFSVLELISDGERGLRLPKMNTAQRNAMRDAFLAGEYYELAYGLFIFNTDNGGCIEFWNGTRWISLCDDGFLTEGLRQRNPASAVILYNTSHTFELPFASDGVCAIGPITYLWQQSTNGGATWGPVPGIPNNLAHLTTPNLTVTTDFRRRATNACGDYIYTAVATVTVLEFDLTLPLEGIVVNPANVHRAIGWVGIPFAAMITPFEADQNVTWSSSHPEIAFVDPATGIVTAISAGVATIIATSVADPSRTAAATINVFPFTPLTTPHPAPGWAPNGGTHTFYLGTAQGAGGVGSFTYQWQGSICGVLEANWVNMPNGTGQHFTTPVFEAVEQTVSPLEDGGLPAGTHRYFRRIAVSGEYTVISNPARVAVFAQRNVSMQPGVFVAEPGMPGALFQWNRNLAHSSSNPHINSDMNNDMPGGSPGTAWYPVNDPCPNGWRIPTRNELTLLTIPRLDANGVIHPASLNTSSQTVGFGGDHRTGWVFPNDGRGDGLGPRGMFFPAALARGADGVLSSNDIGGEPFRNSYWSSTPGSPNSNVAWSLAADMLPQREPRMHLININIALPVRCVAM